MYLHELLESGFRSDPAKPAVVHPGRAALSYADLVDLSDRFAQRLVQAGVGSGDRVGLYVHKSVDAIAAIFGILKLGAAYVPADPDAPPARCAYLLNDCGVKAVLCERTLAQSIEQELERMGSRPELLILEEAPDVPLRALLDDAGVTIDPDRSEAAFAAPSAHLAYILYTSGSTGRPKGVMLSHEAAVSFVDWCSTTFEPRPDDRFSSHAPLHFDLSILDVFVPLKHGATLVLIDEQTGKDPLTLAPLIAEERISVWYSTPSILNLLAQYGKLERHDFSALRHVLFAGEVFPVPQLRRLKAHWAWPRMFNLYGPTETNVCTYYEIPAEIPPERQQPFPIGRTCEHLRSRVVDGDRDVPPGDTGELLITGSGVMSGYWNLPEHNARAFLVDDAGNHWYRTGDIVVLDDDGNHVFHGRRDRMVKRRGYRIELGEIEAGLARHPALAEVAVIAIDAGEKGTRIVAFLCAHPGAAASVIELKQFCAATLPRYMVPDEFSYLAALPRTSTDKIDYQGLKHRLLPPQPV